MTQPVYISQKNHNISPKQLPSNVRNIIKTLQQAGFEAYAVGGCVRDLLLGITPKDFDLATSADPEQIKKLFRNCRLIGRRFRLAHIFFGRDIIEVATFRGHSEDNDGSVKEHPETGMIVHDNQYGTLEDDVWRRDFTANALYYNPEDGNIIDYTGAMRDLKARRLVLIGDPEKRFTEDPVRMLRAIRLATKLGLTIEEKVLAQIKRSAALLGHVSVARLFEELLKLFVTGHSQITYRELQKYGLLTYLLPQTERLAADNKEFQELIEQALINTDQRIQADKSINPAFLLAVFLWQPYLTRFQDLIANGNNAFEAKHMAFDFMYKEQALSVSITKRLLEIIRHMWELQERLEKPSQRHVKKVLEHKRFRAAYDFLVLRSQTTDHNLASVADWWTKLQEAPIHEQTIMIKALDDGKGKKKGGKRKKRKPRYQQQGQPNTADSQNN